MKKINRTGFVSQTGVNIIWWYYSSRLREWNYRNSCGNFWRLYWNPRPGAEIELDGTFYPLDASRIVVIPPRCSFSTRSSGTFAHLAIHFLAPEFLDSVRREFHFFPVAAPDFAAMPELLYQLQDRTRAVEWKMIALYELVFRVVRRFAAAGAEPEERKPADLRVLRIAEAMNADPARIPDNRELSRRSGMSVNTFLRLFKQEFGMSPQQYARILRIDLARSLIWRADRSLDEVAAATGFADRYHFSKVFKAVTQCTPAQFRRFHSATRLLSGAHLE